MRRYVLQGGWYQAMSLGGGGGYKETRKGGKAERKREDKGKLKFKGQNKGTVGKYSLTACGGMASLSEDGGGGYAFRTSM
jgi:hypothetical protein